MRHHAGIRTAAVLAKIPAAPATVAIASVALALGTPEAPVTSGALAGHITYLMQRGAIRRVERGVYQRVEVAS